MAQSDNNAVTVMADARAALIDQVYRSVQQTDADPATIRRLTVPLPASDAIAWLAAQATSRRIYWRDRTGETETAGIGSAETLTATASFDLDQLLEQVSRRTLHSAGSRYFGGLQFNRWNREPEWSHFSAVAFMLPRLELHREGDRFELVCNIIPELDDNRREAIVAEIERLVDDLPASPSRLPSVIRRIDSPEPVEWRRVIEQALASIERGEIGKIALARQSLLTFNGLVDPPAVLSRLAKQSDSCYLFYFQPGREQAFLGATPEQLFARDGRQVTTEAIAGTRRRGDGDANDAALGRELLASDKDRREQAAVTTFISDSLHSLCASVTVRGDRELLRLRRVQHLVTRLSGELQETVTDADLLRSLHPTPAVCGQPREAARTRIANLEPFERGWYAGPVGWINGRASRFAVGIRSARVIGDRVELYAGAGIVDGSTAADEWEEIDAKLNTILSILGV